MKIISKIRYLVIFILMLSANFAFPQGMKNGPMRSITLQGNYTRFLSEYKEVFPSSAGAYVAYSWDFTSGFSIHARTGYFSQSSSRNAGSSSSSIIPLQFGGRYYITNSKFQPYASFMNGANIFLEDIKDTTVLSASDGIRVRYAWQVGLGLRAMVSNNLFFDINTNFNNSFYEDKAMLTGLEYNAGLGIILK